MKIKTTNCRKDRKVVLHLINTFGTRQHKMAYASLINNIVGLVRKVQSLNKRIKNRDELIALLESQLADERKERLFGDGKADRDAMAAEGVEMFAKYCWSMEHASADRRWIGAARNAELFAAKLRAGEPS